MGRTLRFHPDALAEFRKLQTPIREFFKRKLLERMENPTISKDALNGDLAGTYKIKQNSTGMRLVYIFDNTSLTVLAVGKRDESIVYKTASKRVTH